MDFTKIVKADLDSSCRELSNGGPGFVGAFPGFFQGSKQSSCSSSGPFVDQKTFANACIPYIKSTGSFCRVRYRYIMA